MNYQDIMQAIWRQQYGGNRGQQRLQADGSGGWGQAVQAANGYGGGNAMAQVQAPQGDRLDYQAAMQGMYGMESPWGQPKKKQRLGGQSFYGIPVQQQQGYGMQQPMTPPPIGAYSSQAPQRDQVSYAQQSRQMPNRPVAEPRRMPQSWQ